MATQQLLVRLPEELVQRLRRRVPARSRSAFVQKLLEQALPAYEDDEDPLYKAALDVEHDATLTAEMDDWDATVVDGLAAALR